MPPCGRRSGRPSWRNLHREVANDFALILQGQAAGVDELAQVGRLDALTPRRVPGGRANLLGGTARTIRSWASEIQISVYDKPSGT